MKYYGSIGFASNEETSPGVWEEIVIERKYMGDLIRLSRNLQNQKPNGTITINNQISIVADPYANDNFMFIRYAELNGHKWNVEGVEVDYPRLLLSLGGLYSD